jgi:lipoic acid synthetase
LFSYLKSKFQLHVEKGTVPRVTADMPVGKRPDWFRVPAPGGSHTKFDELKKSVKELNLHTVCEEAQCPNIGECWNGKQTASNQLFILPLAI